jgi:hypothetical protein
MHTRVQHFGFDQHRRRRADRTEKSALFMLTPKPLKQRLARFKIIGAVSAARQDDGIVIRIGDIGKKRVGLHFHAVRAFNRKRSANSGGNNLNPTATQNIDYSNSFNIFKAVSKRYERLSHIPPPFGESESKKFK